MLKILKNNPFAWTTGTPLLQDPLATGGLVIVNDPPIEARTDDDDDVDIPDTILWDLAGGNGVGAPVYDEAPLTLDVTPGVAGTAADDDDDLPDIIIWDIDGGSIAPEREGGLPDIMVRDDDDDSVAQQSGAPGVIQASAPGTETFLLGGWDGDGHDTAMRRNEDADHWNFEKPGGEVLPPSDPAEIIGTNGNDLLVGTDDEELIDGRAGNDILSGLGDRDWLLGGTGNDTIFGGEGNDIMEGQEGDDVLFGGSGADMLIGGIGDDELTSGEGFDSFGFAGVQGADTGVDRITDYDIDQDRFVFYEGFLDVGPGESLIQNVIALEGNEGAGLWADVTQAGLIQIAVVEGLTTAELQQELTEAWLI